MSVFKTASSEALDKFNNAWKMFEDRGGVVNIEKRGLFQNKNHWTFSFRKNKLEYWESSLIYDSEMQRVTEWMNTVTAND